VLSRRIAQESAASSFLEAAVTELRQSPLGAERRSPADVACRYRRTLSGQAQEADWNSLRPRQIVPANLAG